MTAAGLDPALLDTPDAPFPTAGSSGSSQVPSLAPAVTANVNISSSASVVSHATTAITAPPPPPPPPAAPTPIAEATTSDNGGTSASASAGGGMCVKDHPDYEGFFRMLKVCTTMIINHPQSYLVISYHYH